MIYYILYSVQANQTRIEGEFSFEELKILRELVYRNIRRKGSLKVSWILLILICKENKLLVINFTCCAML